MKTKLLFIFICLLLPFQAFAGEVKIIGGSVGMVENRAIAKGLVKNDTDKPVMVKVKCSFKTAEGQSKDEVFFAANGDEIQPGKSVPFEQILFSSGAESGELSVDELVYSLSDSEKSDPKFALVANSSKSFAGNLSQPEKRIIKHFKFTDDHGYAYVVGEIENTMDYPCQIQLEAVARNKKGEVVDVKRFYPVGLKKLRPGQKSAFKSFVTTDSSATRAELSVFEVTPE